MGCSDGLVNGQYRYVGKLLVFLKLLRAAYHGGAFGLHHCLHFEGQIVDYLLLRQYNTAVVAPSSSRINQKEDTART